tara:strand:- start:8547 stop:9146 length:600 start_codon:yes stop_codon:yes gene_type:complete
MHHYQAINRRIKHEINFPKYLYQKWVGPNVIRAERSEQETDSANHQTSLPTTHPNNTQGAICRLARQCRFNQPPYTKTDKPEYNSGRAQRAGGLSESKQAAQKVLIQNTPRKQETVRSTHIKSTPESYQKSQPHPQMNSDHKSDQTLTYHQLSHYPKGKSSPLSCRHPDILIYFQIRPVNDSIRIRLLNEGLNPFTHEH